MAVTGLSTDACVAIIKKDVTHIREELKDIKVMLITKVDKSVCNERVKSVDKIAESQKQLHKFVWGVLASTILLLVSIILTNVWSK